MLKRRINQFYLLNTLLKDGDEEEDGGNIKLNMRFSFVSLMWMFELQCAE